MRLQEIFLFKQLRRIFLIHRYVEEEKSCKLLKINALLLSARALSVANDITLLPVVANLKIRCKKSLE